MVDTPWIVGMNDFYRSTLAFINMTTVKFSHTIPLWYFQTLNCPIAIDSHCANMDNMTILIEFHDSQQDIFGRGCVIGISIINGFDRFHRVRCSLLLCKMDNNMRVKFLKFLIKPVFFLGNINFREFDLFPCYFFPPVQSLSDWFNWSDTTVAILLVNGSSGEIIDNEDVPA